MTVAEPIRDDDEPRWDPFELVACFDCDGKGTRVHERRDGTVVRRSCRTCSGRKLCLRGNPPESPYCLTLPSETTVYSGSQT